MIFTSHEKSAIINTLGHIMHADDRVDPSEQTFMDNILREFAITYDEIVTAAHLDRTECRNIFQKMSQEKKDKVSKCLMDMVSADGKVDLRELRVLHDLF